MALASQAAHAHAGHVEESAAAAGALPVSHWMAPCPAGQGHLCLCGKLSACDSGGQKGIAGPASYSLAVVLASPRAQLPRIAPRLSRPSLSVAFPRAPPPYS